MNRQIPSSDEEMEGETPVSAQLEPAEPESEIISDVTQIYLHEIGLNPLL